MAKRTAGGVLSPGCWKYDVFLSFRGDDVPNNFVDHLYNALVERTILTYKDDETLPRGDTIGPALLNAIQESRISLIVFSKNYADSSWCLDELAYIMKCKEERGQIVIPIFYDLDPSDVRKQKGQFGQAFSKHFSANNEKVESWKEVLVDSSNIAGWETKFVANGHEAKCIREIVDSVLDKLQSLNSAVDDDDELVGMVTRLQDLKSQLEIGSGGVRMVGIWGVGGGGKTTLATSLYMEISANFNSCCFVDNVREESRQQHGLKKLQGKILSTVFKKEIEVESVAIGKKDIKHMLCSRNVLVVLDDVDALEQLEALAGRHNWFGDGSRIIITTRDEHVLTAHRVDKACPVSLLSHDEATQLFRKHAYREVNPVEDYDELSSGVIKYVKGLPLALKVLGSFLYDKDKNGWLGALDKLKETPNLKVNDQLKISYDGLDPNEKELFLDIACFFRRGKEEKVMKILEACGFHPRIGVMVLKQKSLITISKHGTFDMHDLVQEMGHHIVRGEHPNNPEKHSRVWRNEDIEELCAGNARTENHMIEAIQYHASYKPAQSFMTLVSNLKKLRFLDVCLQFNYICEGATFLSNDLKYIDFFGNPASLFCESFQPRKLVVLKLYYTLQLKELPKSMPCLKELQLTRVDALVRTPDFGGLPCLKKVIFSYCGSLEEIHPSIGSHSSLVHISVAYCQMLKRFPTIVRMEKLERFEIQSCRALLEFPTIKANMDSLENLYLEDLFIKVLPSSVGRYCTNLISLTLADCSKLKTIEGNFNALKRLERFDLYGDTQLEKFPKDLFDVKCCLEKLRFRVSGELNIFRPSPPHLPHLLRKLNLSWCKLKDGEIPREIGRLSSLIELRLDSNHFSRVDINLSQLTQLKLLSLSDCEMLVELPKLPPNLAILQAENCNSLKAIREDIYSNCKWLCSFSVRSVLSECGNFFGGKRLLESMLQGNALENHQCMSLILRGVEVLKKFEPGCLRGRRYSLQLPENWFNEYTGFLFCSVFEGRVPDSLEITMGQKEQVFREELYKGERKNTKIQIQTWVVYVSFGSLKSTAWWDQTSTKLDFSVAPRGRNGYVYEKDELFISGFGARLVSKKNQIKETRKKNYSSEFSSDDGDYKCIFKIPHDAKSILVLMFRAVFSPPSSDRSQDSSEHRGSPVPNTSSSPIESSSPGCWKYDVFLSFRGEDVRKNFLSVGMVTRLQDLKSQLEIGSDGVGGGDIEQILSEAQHRWLRPAEICEIFRNYTMFKIAFEHVYRPPNGSLFLFDRRVLRNFRKDGHNWRKLLDGKSVGETYERLRVGSIDVLNCYCAQGEENQNFQRRSYSLIKEELSNIVLVHYRDVKPKVDDYDDDGDVSGVSSVTVETLPPTQLDIYQTKYPEDMVTHNRVLTAISAALEDKSKQFIGIYGLGGVGKTTLAKEVVARLKNTNMFDDVAFTTVSQKVDVEKIKKDLENAKMRMMKGDRILIILDDVWEKLNLEELGIQCENNYMNCKILLTSRSEKVCRKMSAQSMIHLNLLPTEEAWILFKRVVGGRLETDANLKPVAKKVVEECGGLPLLIQAIGNALKDENIQSWESALSQLKEPATSEMERDIEIPFTRLRLSYEYLKSQEAKSCFLLCSFFPEDDDISLEDLVCYLVGLEKFDSIKDARDRVQNAVNILISSGLLLNGKWEGYTKMHDVVREVAFIIASKDENKFLVEAGKGLKEWLPGHNMLESYTGISLMKNWISKLPDYEVHLSSLDIFLVNNNPLLRMISDEFIKGMKEVKVLDMGWCLISHLPQSLKLLTKLRMLNLKENYLFHEISILGEMKELEILILNRTGIKEIPKEIGQLVNLRRLEVSGCRYMTRVTPGVISKLQSLEELCIDLSRVIEGANGCIAEVMKLLKLTFLDLVVKSCEVIPEGFNLEKLNGFVIQIGEYHRDFYRGNELRMSDRYLIISSKHLVIPLLKRIEKFIEVSRLITILNGIQNLNNIMPELYHGGFNKLEHIQLNYCHNVLCLLEDCTRCDGDEGKTEEKLFKELKHLKLWYLDNLEVLWKYECVSLTNLVSLLIEGCDKLERVFTVSVAQGLVNLKKLGIEGCSALEEVIWGGGGGGGDDKSRNVIVFPSLATISLIVLERLKMFFNSTGNCSIEYPSLVYVKIHDCESMKIWGLGIHETPNLKRLEMDYVEPIVVDGPFAINEAVEKLWRK